MMVLQSSAAAWAPSGSAFSSLSSMAAGTPAITLAFQVAGKGRKEGPIFFRTLPKVPIKCLDLYWPHRSYTDTPSCDGDWEMSCSWVPCAEIEVGVTKKKYLEDGSWGQPAAFPVKELDRRGMMD